MRVGRENSESPVGDVPTIQIRWGRGDANIGVCGVTVPRRWGRRRGASRPSLISELANGAEGIVCLRAARGDHRRVGVGVTAIDHGENSAEWIIADLEVILVDEGPFTEAEAGQIISRCGPAGLTQFWRIDEHESNMKAAFNVESVTIMNSRHVALDTESNRSRACQWLWTRRCRRRQIVVGRGRGTRKGRPDDYGRDDNGSDSNRDAENSKSPHLPPAGEMNLPGIKDLVSRCAKDTT